MATSITIPDFNFAAFYYPELLEALIQYKRLNVPELTEETPYEPFIQLLRAFALVGHINNTTMDLIANESYLATAKLVESIREHLNLIDYQLAPAVPAQVDLVYELSAVLGATAEVIPDGAQFATVGTPDDPSVLFEVVDAISVDRTDQFDHVLGFDESVGGGTYTDYTTLANAGNDWTPWSTAAAEDALYFGHQDIQWDTLNISSSTQAAGLTGIFEFYGNHYYTIAPTSVADTTGELEINVNSILGTSDRAGSYVRVTLNSTGALEDVQSVWSGGVNKITTSDYMGQTAVSITATDYTLSRPWYELSGVVDGSVDLSVSGADVTYTFPQSLSEYWQEVSVDNKTAYWIRYRLISVSGPTDPVLTQITIDDGKQYLLASATQGQTNLDSAYSGTGLADQSFELARDYFILNSQVVTVDDVTWVEVDNFLSSDPTSNHYTVSLGNLDRATINFGNGINGAIPSDTSDNILVEYRHNAELDGNVGFNTITTDRTGLIYMNKVWNPRASAGWSQSESSTELGLARAKIAGPASLRTQEVALNGDDAATLAISYVDDDGASPFVRAAGFEGTYGDNTIELVVTSAGGALATAAQLTAAEAYFNGDQTSTPVKQKRIVANHELTAVNYTPRSIDITATVWGDVTQEAVENALNAILQPEALDDDGVSFLWSFGGEVAISRLLHEIHGVSENIRKASIAEGNVDLETRELPVAGTISVTVNS